MTEHVKQWLNAYVDGELHGARLQQVGNHLAECDECRAEMVELRGLSALMQNTPPAEEFISTDRFVSNLALKLPRRFEAPRTRKVFEIGWWLLPVGILGTWAFLQVTFLLSSLVQSASDAGLLGTTFTGLQGTASQAVWYTALTDLFGGRFAFIFSPLNSADLFIQNLIAPYFWQLLLAVIYSVWLVSWWVRQQSRSSGPGTGEFPSQPHVESGA